MAYKPEKRLAVRASYVSERLPLPAAADKHTVSISTAQAWKRQAKLQGDDWDKARSASRLAAGGLGDITAQLLEDFALLFQSTLEELKSAQIGPLEKAEAIARLSDSYNKTMKAASASSPKLSELAIAFKVLDRFAQFVKTHSPDDLPRFAALLEPFAADVTAEFSA